MQFRYNSDKNAQLLAERGIGFEEIITEINNGNLLTVKHHHNQIKCPKQLITYVKCLGEIYLVPYLIEQNDMIFLKTAYPSRKATKSFFESS